MGDLLSFKGWDYFKFVLLIFASICIEFIYGLLLEPLIYGVQVQSWSSRQMIIHWIITCLSWGISLYFILLYAKGKVGFSIKGNDKNIEVWRWGVIVVCIILCTIVSYISWKGFKPTKEFMNLGLIKFIFQYLYYFFETCMITGIIIFGQLAFEKWFKNSNIPYGGIICALIWGVPHFATKGIVTGILSIFLGFVFGATYLLLKRDAIKTVPVLFFMFIL